MMMMMMMMMTIIHEMALNWPTYKRIYCTY